MYGSLDTSDTMVYRGSEDVLRLMAANAGANPGFEGIEEISE